MRKTKKYSNRAKQHMVENKNNGSETPMLPMNQRSFCTRSPAGGLSHTHLCKLLKNRQRPQVRKRLFFFISFTLFSLICADIACIEKERIEDGKNRVSEDGEVRFSSPCELKTDVSSAKSSQHSQKEISVMYHYGGLGGGVLSYCLELMRLIYSNKINQ